MRTFLPKFSTPSHRHAHGQAWSLAWPLILSNLTAPLMGLADTAMLGHLDSPLHLAAVAIGANVLTFSLWVFGFLRMGTTSLTGRALGAQQPLQVKLLLYRGLLLGAVLGLALIVLQFFLLPQILQWMTPDPEVRQMALDYSLIRLAGAPAVLMTYAAIGWFVGLQQSRKPLAVALWINLVNLILDWLLILVLGWGSIGAALASLCAEYAGLVLVLMLITRELRAYKRQQVTGAQLKVGWLPLVRINRDLFIRTASLLAVFSFFTAQGAYFGPEVVAANAILLQLLLLASHGLDGYAHAAETLVARDVGGGNFIGFRRHCFTTGSASLMLALLLSALFFALQIPLVHLITDLPALRDELQRYYGWLILLPLVSVWSYLFDGIFIGAGRTRSLRNWMVVAVLSVFLPLWWFSRNSGNHGLWLAFTLFNLFRGVSLGAQFALELRIKRGFGAIGR